MAWPYVGVRELCLERSQPASLSAGENWRSAPRSPHRSHASWGCSHEIPTKIRRTLTGFVAKTETPPLPSCREIGDSADASQSTKPSSPLCLGLAPYRRTESRQTTVHFREESPHCLGRTHRISSESGEPNTNSIGRSDQSWSSNRLRSSLAIVPSWSARAHFSVLCNSIAGGSSRPGGFEAAMRIGFGGRYRNLGT